MTKNNKILFFISALEFCDESHRIYPLFCLMASYSISSILTPVLAMYLPSWQSLLMVATFPNIIVIIAGLCGCIPESIRWQVCEGKAQDVFETVVKIADFNKVKKFGVSILYLRYFCEYFPLKLFFFESVKCRKFK